MFWLHRKWTTLSECFQITAVGLSALERNVFPTSLRAVFDNPDPLVQQGCFVPHQEIKKPPEPFVVQITLEWVLNGVPPWVYNSQHVKNLSDRTEKCCYASCGSNTAGQIERKGSVGTSAHPSLFALAAKGNPGWPTGSDNNQSSLEFPEKSVRHRGAWSRRAGFSPSHTHTHTHTHRGKREQCWQINLWAQIRISADRLNQNCHTPDGCRLLV